MINPDLTQVRQLQQSGQLLEAEKICITLLENEPASQPVQVLRALLLTQLQKSDDAQAQIDHTITPEDALTASDLGLLCVLRGEPARAAELLEFARQQADMDYVVLARLGALRMMEGDLVKAEDALRQALERSPEHSSILSNLGGLLLRQDKAEEALLVYEARKDL